MSAPASAFNGLTTNTLHAYNVNRRVTLNGGIHLISGGSSCRSRAPDQGRCSLIRRLSALGDTDPHAVPGRPERLSIASSEQRATPTSVSDDFQGGQSTGGVRQSGLRAIRSLARPMTTPSLFGVRYDFGVPPPPPPAPSGPRPVAGFAVVPGVLRLGQGES